MEPTERAWFIICCYFKPGDFFFLLIPLSIIQLFYDSSRRARFCAAFSSRSDLFSIIHARCAITLTGLSEIDLLHPSGWCLLTSMRDSPSQLIKTKLLRNFQRLRHLAGNDNCQFSRPWKKTQSPTEQTSSLYRRWFLASRFACASLNSGLHFEKRK